MARKKLRGKSKNKFDKYLLLSGKRIFVIMIAWFVAVILHNLVYALIKTFYPAWKGDEAVLFIFAMVIIPIYLLIGAVYSLIWMVKNKKYPKKRFYIKLITSIIGGLLITFTLINVGFLNDMYLIPIIVFSFLIFGIISLFQKTERRY